MIDAYDLATYLCKVDQDNEDVDFEESLLEKYGIDYSNFERLINDLLPLIYVAKTPITKKLVQGFAIKKRGIWLAWTDVK